jgi:hypothetical protein
MGCEATMNFSLLEVQRRVSCAEGGRLHEPVRKGARCWRGSGCILTTGIRALNFCFSLSQRLIVPSRIQPCRYVQMVGTTHPCITPLQLFLSQRTKVCIASSVVRRHTYVHEVVK